MLGITSKLPSLSDLNIKGISGDWYISDYKTNEKIASFDTFLGYDYMRENKTAEKPVEKGSFSSYNKIVLPEQVNVVLAKGGSSFELKQALKKLEQYQGSTDTINIVLPFKSYINMSLNKLSHGMKEGGASSLLVCELGLKEVQERKASYQTLGFLPDNVKEAQDASTQDVGLKTTEIYMGTV